METHKTSAYDILIKDVKLKISKHESINRKQVTKNEKRALIVETEKIHKQHIKKNRIA